MPTITRAKASVEAVVTEGANPVFRFSGHETFACRFAWLPKAYDLLKTNPSVWTDDDECIVELGIGKNMVRSLRFWAQAYGVVSTRRKQLEITEFGELLFGKRGHDPYLEHWITPWILHWKLAGNVSVPLFSWFYLFNQWPLPEFSRGDVLAAFKRESDRLGLEHSDVTLEQHLDVLLHTYLPSRTTANLEDSLDGPLADLGLLRVVGQRRAESGRHETIYAFDRSRKENLPQSLFDYVVDDFWTARHSADATLSAREICFGVGSPGRLLLLTEEEIHGRLEQGSKAKGAPFEYLPSAIAGRVVRRGKLSPAALLNRVYEGA